MKCDHEILTCNSCGQEINQNDVELIKECKKIKYENKSLIEYCRNLKNKNDELETKVEALKKCLKEVL